MTRAGTRPTPAAAVGVPPTLDEAVARVLGEGGRLREAQRDALSGLRAHDTLLVARTGAGKTAVYAIATMMSGRPTVVVSPLLALQRDQVTSLAEAGLRAEAVSSAVPARARRAALEDAARGQVEVLLLAPEQLARDDVVEALAGAGVGLLVVDEAHCVTEWGHDFRPDYLHLAGAAERMGSPRVLALTATASPHVRQEVVERLGMRSPRVLVHDTDRPNIWLGARTTAGAPERDAAVVESAVATSGAGIVYARTRAHVEELAALLADAGRPALGYHGGMSGRERSRVEEAFLTGEAELVVATSAFGMGVDRADVRFVVHAGPPPSLDAYYQEVGRAGRDGEDALAVLVHHPDDVGPNHYLRAGGAPRRATLQAVLGAVEQGPGTRADVAGRSGLGARTVARALAALAAVGGVEERAGTWRRLGGGSVAEVVRAVRERADDAAALDRSRVELVRTYAETTDCRRRVLLELLGEDHPQACGRCDSCDAGTSVDVTDAPFRPGQAVEHVEWGSGTVSVVEQGRVTVLFESRGYVTLDADLVVDSGVLAAADG
ncbi:RecQ family ATP-dependent DNA helicase [Cellulomonas carbonis]|uniref:RecQ family ATP-dependent DNA helicase n=1 Tax=Cellulomonas carbonis TaxID=1386092 RepID=UPI0019BBFDE8|nr:RecQ family ATP-dependent DNA helicase [Cellulomonas carbonis]GGB93664.1 ATP-dependent DNA helicase RecQ [Cellulomonas carbonis]